MIENAAILFIAMGITKIVGALLKIPLGNILGGLGMSYFSSAYSVFGPVYALTTAAIPTVLTKIVAQNAAAGNFRNVRRIKKAALKAAIPLGFAGTVLILVISVPFARYIADAPNSIPAMLIIAPSVFLCCVASVYRGYYEGLRDMLPTAVSQVIEAVVKAIFGVALSYIVLSVTGSLPYAAAAAVLGIVLSEVAALGFLFLRGFGRDGISDEEIYVSPPPDRNSVLIRRFIREALPITLGAVVINLSSIIDLVTITNCINSSVTENKAYFQTQFPDVGIRLAELGNFIYGSYTGIVASLFTLIPAVTAMLSKSALPAVAAAWEKRNDAHLARSLKILFKGTFMLGLPLCLGMAAFAAPVLNLLYLTRPAEAAICVRPLVILSLGGITLSLTALLFSVFYAIGRADLPIKLMLTGAGVKLALNLWLIPNPELNISGAAIATVGCYGVISVLGLLCLVRLVKIRVGIAGFFGKALFNSAACAVSALGAYHFVFGGLGDIIRLGLSVALGAGVYGVMSFTTDREMFIRYVFRKKEC
jgi:stage V sporulation protein B